MRACYLHNSNFTSVIVKVKKVLYFLRFVLRCRIFAVMWEGKMKLAEIISAFHKLHFAKILQLYLRKSLVIVNVPENCNHICAKIIFVKFVMSVHPCGGESWHCDSPQGFKYYLPQAARRHSFLTTICNCFVVLVFLFVSYFHLLTASDAESMVFTRNLPWIFENMSRLRSLGMLIIFTQMFKLDSYNSQNSQKSVL